MVPNLMNRGRKYGLIKDPLCSISQDPTFLCHFFFPYIPANIYIPPSFSPKSESIIHHFLLPNLENILFSYIYGNNGTSSYFNGVD